MLPLIFLAAGCTEPGPPSEITLRSGLSGSPGDPTYHRDIAPLLAEHCAECHRPAGIAPFSLLSYEEARARAASIAISTASRRMPPFNLDNSGDCNTWTDARWLTDAEIATIGDWVRAGAPEGEPPAAPPEVPPLWTMDRVDLSLPMEEPYTPDASVQDDYRCFVLDPELSEDRYITGFQIHLGAPRMVHHLTLFALDSEEDERDAEALDQAEPGPGYTCYGDTVVPSRWLVGSGPGDEGGLLPEGTGSRMGAGRKTVLQMHYNRLNGLEPDRTTIDLKLEPEVPYETDVNRVAATDLLLPPGLPEVDQSESMTLGGDFTLWGIWPHMHNLGTRLTVTARRPGSEKCLARVDRYAFHWQGFAFYEEPIHVREGDTLKITCTYDTTDRETTTTWGSGTDDEMCIGFFYVSEGFD